jgi:hypothetical protein
MDGTQVLTIYYQWPVQTLPMVLSVARPDIADGTISGPSRHCRWYYQWPVQTLPMVLSVARPDIADGTISGPSRQNGCIGQSLEMVPRYSVLEPTS